MKQSVYLGIDVGGSGIKGALVDLEHGKVTTERYRVTTPIPATPKKVSMAFKEVVDHFKYQGPIGVGFPAIIKNGVAHSASNIDDKWIGTNVQELFSSVSGNPVFVANDADVAGLGELKYGEGYNESGTVLFLTIGTGIGSALFIDGDLLPNTEFGHLFLKNQKQVAEKYTADSVRKKEDLSWEEWGKRLNEYLEHVDFLFNPKLILLGGGASKKYDKYANEIMIKTPIRTASLKNMAGIIGAASLAHRSGEVASLMPKTMV